MSQLEKLVKSASHISNGFLIASLKYPDRQFLNASQRWIGVRHTVGMLTKCKSPSVSATLAGSTLNNASGQEAELESMRDILLIIWYDLSIYSAGMKR